MIGLYFFGLVALWLVAGVAFGWWIYWKTDNRGWQLVATFFALWLPLWDVIPGYVLYRKAVREVGGVRIYRTVQADGYLDQTQVLGNCWKTLMYTPYAYCENYEPNNAHSFLGPLNAMAGFYEYRLAPIESPECAPFRDDLNVEVMQRSYQLGRRCVVATRRDTPFSRFEYLTGSDTWRSSWPVPPVFTSWTRVRDRSTHEVLGEAVRVSYVAWITRFVGSEAGVGFAYLSAENVSGNGKGISVGPDDVLVPSDRASKEDGK